MYVSSSEYHHKVVTRTTEIVRRSFHYAFDPSWGQRHGICFTIRLTSSKLEYKRSCVRATGMRN